MGGTKSSAHSSGGGRAGAGRRHPGRREGALRADREVVRQHAGLIRGSQGARAHGRSPPPRKREKIDHHLDLLDARELADGWTTRPTSRRRSRIPDLVVAAVEGGRRRCGHDRRHGGTASRRAAPAYPRCASSPGFSSRSSWTPARRRLRVDRPVASGARDPPGLGVLLAVDRGEELPLVHPRAALDVQPLRLVVELLLRLALGSCERLCRPGGSTNVAVGLRDAVRDSPERARSLLTVRGDLLGAVLETPRSFALSLMCSYWRARFVPFLTPRGGIKPPLLACLAPTATGTVKTPDTMAARAERCPSWPKERDWKSRTRRKLGRGFESRPLRLNR